MGKLILILASVVGLNVPKSAVHVCVRCVSACVHVCVCVVLCVVFVHVCVCVC